MLSALYIRNLAIVRGLELNFAGGLTVLTGETGAGKSILIDALSLVLGARADADVIRARCTQAEILATFNIDHCPEAARWLADNGLEEEGQCIVRRAIYTDNPTRGFINDRPVTMASLRELGALLVDIHGQQEHQNLLRREIQRHILDDYAGHADAVNQLTGLYHQWLALQQRIDALRKESTDREARLDLLRYQVRELEALGLEAGEIPELEQEHARLAHANELLEGLQQAVGTLYDDDEGAVSGLLARTTTRLDGLLEYDPRLVEISRLITEAAVSIDEAAAQLHQRLASVESDPNRLQWLEGRLAAIHDLARKHRVPGEELPAMAKKLTQELADLQDADTSLETLTTQFNGLRDEYQVQAGKISQRRRAAAVQFSKQVSAHMQELGMPGGAFQADVTTRSDPQPAATGLDRIEYQVTANPGQPLRPLARVASGGELSRMSLAIQVVIAGVGRVPTLIFDEVDVGIGGRVAEIVGRELRALGVARQVLCITHLAQAAAQGDHHLRVSKTPPPELSVSIDPLTGGERVDEIARMIGGVTITEQTHAHAAEMLQRAAAV